MRREFDWLDGRHLDPAMRFMEDLQFDSVALVHLQVAVEDNFGLRFHPLDDDLMEIFATVGSLAAAVDAKRE
jgi:acyl carrier protein